MKLQHLFAAGLVVLSGCASRHVPSDVVDAWSQRPDERGKLPVGIVIAIEPGSFRVDRPKSDASSTYAINPAAGAAMAAAVDAIRDSGTAYVHTVRLTDGSERKVTLDNAYKVGDCLAFRSGLQKDDQWPVRALTGECASSGVK